jgi:hypothetical protein
MIQGIRFLSFGFCIIACSPVCRAASQATNIAPRAAQVLREACQYLAESPYFSITAEAWREHVGNSGEKLQFTRVIQLEVKRPNRMHAEIIAGHGERAFWYEGTTLTTLDRKQNLYSIAPMPATLDGALDKAHDEFGIDLPLIDLAVSDPYANATARVQTGRYFGLEAAMGFTCHHLAFTQDNIDWQVWIEDGPRPLIRKFVITHKNEAGSPEFTALIRSWNLADRISNADFVFQPPRGAVRIQAQNEAPFGAEPKSGKHAAIASPKSR